jgi:hypothetical protein
LLDIFFHRHKMHIAWAADLELHRRDIGLIFRIPEHRHAQLLGVQVSSFSF